MKTLLQVNQLDASYGKRQVLHGVSMDLSSDEKILLAGPNGSGKTTLLKTLIGLITPLKGSIHSFGEEITNSTVRARVRNGFGYLLQDRNIVPDLTVDENLELGGYLLSKNDINKRKHLVLESLEFLKSKLPKRAGLLSGGERQSLALAMVMMRNPRILFLDEPSAGLAPKAASGILENVKRLQESFHVELVCMVEHNLKLALPWASRIYVLVDGRLVFTSTEPGKYLKEPMELEKHYFNSPQK